MIGEAPGSGAGPGQHSGAGKASGGGVVDGVVLEDLSPDDLRTLDGYEEVDEGVYRRELAEVQVWGCGPSTPSVTAYVYVAGPTLAALAAR